MRCARRSIAPGKLTLTLVVGMVAPALVTSEGYASPGSMRKDVAGNPSQPCSARAVPLARTGLLVALVLYFTISPISARPAQAVRLIDQTTTQTMPLTIGVYSPAYPDDLSSLEAYERGAGRSIELVHWFALWGGWKATFNRADLDLVRQRGSTPMITWEPWAGSAKDPGWSLRAAILSGASDVYIHAWARGLADYGGPVMLRFAHEMHDQTYPWAVGVNGNTASEYVSVWRYVHRIFEAEGARNVQWVWNPNTMAGAALQQYQAIYQSLYPGDDVVDWTGLDVFNGGSDLPDWGGWRSFSDILTVPYAALQSVARKPVVLAEVGSAEDGGHKGQWINAAFHDLEQGQFPAVQALVWFDVNKEERWALHSSDATLAVWLAALRADPTM